VPSLPHATEKVPMSTSATVKKFLMGKRRSVPWLYIIALNRPEWVGRASERKPKLCGGTRFSIPFAHQIIYSHPSLDSARGWRSTRSIAGHALSVGRIDGGSACPCYAGVQDRNDAQKQGRASGVSCIQNERQYRSLFPGVRIRGEKSLVIR
jgi:hypothetical protein